MREPVTRDRLTRFLRELSHGVPRGTRRRVYLVGGGTAVLLGWRLSSVDVDLHAARVDLFRDLPRLKERLRINVELVRPENFVPPLRGSSGRHVFVTAEGRLDIYHYDPYAQAFSKIVRGFERDLADARAFLASGMVKSARLRELVRGIPDEAYLHYPRLSRPGVENAVEDFLSAEAG